MAAGLLVLGVVLAAPKYELFGWNSTPSMPEGLYVRSVLERHTVGKTVTIRTPSIVEHHFRSRGYVGTLPTILKPLAAGPGDHVCVTDHLEINGQYIAPVLSAASNGTPMPRWDGCRVLDVGEWFTYAPRILDSFDSRYYGPVREADIIGVYRPVWVED